jgi:hypothetical protein
VPGSSCRRAASACAHACAELLGSRRESHFYIEARSERTVQDAIQGLRDVLSTRGIMRVPHTEMTDAITVKDAAKQRLHAGSWVRVNTAGVYRGDLAQVRRALPRARAHLARACSASAERRTRCCVSSALLCLVPSLLL